MSDPVFQGDSHDPGHPSASDCFGPPSEPCECHCLHCGRIFMSDRIWFQKVIGSRDGFDGFWMCPTPNCDGAGFTFDIFPTDPNHPANGGWSWSDDPEEEDEEMEMSEMEFEEIPEWDPEESYYASLDEELGEEDEDDLEGEEWKLGLAPGERPPEPPWASEARQEWERQREKYDQPDQRPRTLDWTNREQQSHTINEDDIPF